MVTTEQIKALEERQTALHTHLHIDDRRLELDEQESLTHAPDFWDDPGKAEEQLKKVAGIKYWITAYDAIASAMEELHLLPEFIREGVSAPEELDAQYGRVLEMIEALEMRNMLGGEEDRLGAIMEINSGAGGTESLDWASMLMRMYMRWGEANGYQVKVVDVQDGEEVGIKSATLEFVGEFAYGYLKSESGVHRLVRISPTDDKKRRQTTFAGVEVIPVLPDDIDIEISPDDIRVDVYHASGPGGQGVNTTDSAVRVTHFPSGIVVTCQNERSQIQNKAACMQILKARLYEIELEKRAEALDEIRGPKTTIGFGNQIRSYVLYPYQMVKDLRSGVETSNVEAVLDDGDLDPFVIGYHRWATGNADAEGSEV